MCWPTVASFAKGARSSRLSSNRKVTTGSRQRTAEKERARRRTREMVTELVKSENTYQTAFRSVRESSPAVAWLELVRNSAMDRFEQLGFPSVTQEDWKYTNLATLAKEGFAPATTAAPPRSSDLKRFAYPETAEAHLVVVDGFLRED